MGILSSEIIYEAVLDDGVFAALPSLLADACGARSVWFHWEPAGDGLLMVGDNGYFPPDYLETYASQFAAVDPWLTAARLPERLNRFWDFGQDVTDDQFENSLIWNEMARVQGDDTFRCLGAVFSTGRGRGAIGMHRARRQPAFGSALAEQVQTQADDLRRMLILRSELPFQINGRGRLHISAGHIIRYADSQANIWLSDGTLRTRSGKLQPSPELAVVLAQAMAPDNPKAGACRLRIPEGWLDIQVSPLRPGEVAPGAILLLTPRVHLTRRERQMLQLLSQGLRIEAVAAIAGIARVTAEMHLYNARRKLKAATLTAAVASAIRGGLI
jgi:DNA-binding CsgD family transcriptional regulator